MSVLQQFDLSGKTALVTGCKRGIGKAMLDKLFESFRRKEITNVYTAVRWDAVDMLSFFKSVGFGRSDFINLIRKL